jgi:DNA helicase-2/ATP-dependent DNA helicase PcrA
MGYDGRDGDKSIRIVEDDSRARFLDNYKTIARGSRGTYVIPIHKFYKDYRGRLDSIRFDLRDIDARLRDRLDQSKSRFHNDGFATYQDAEYLCLCMLRHYEWLTKLLSARFPHIIIDECQDLSDVQLCILYELLEEETTLHFVGDLDQAIYAFKKVNPDHIYSFVERQGFFVRRLKTNYRSNQSIADVCTNLMNSRLIIGNESERFEESCVLWQYTDENLSSLKRHFHELTQDAGLTTDKCCVIARGRSVLEALQPERIGRRSSCVALCANALQCWHATNSNTEDLTTALSNIGEAISRLAYSGYGNRQNQSCPEDLSPKEWRWFLAKTLDGFNGLYPFVDQDDQNLTWSDWARELKAYLCDLWDELPLPGEDWDNVRRRIRSPRGLSRSAVSSTVGRPNTFSGLRITTIHNVKGETFEAVLLVSSPDRRSPGGHFSHWLNPEQSKEEYQRFAYVAFSRPKHLLIVAAPQLDAEELHSFEDLGFIPKDIDDHDIGIL